MQFQRLKDKNYNIKIPKKSAFPIETPDDFIQLPMVTLANSKRGGAKTTSLTHLLRLMQYNNALERIILVSPTYENNKHYFEDLPLNESDVLEPEIDVIPQIENILDEEALEYEEYVEKTKRYKRLMDMLHKSEMSVYEIPADLLLEFADENDNIAPPQYKYKVTNRPPSVAIFFDDCLDSPVFRPKSGLGRFVISHRHKGKTKNMGSIGCSLLFATQAYTSNGAGLQRAIRSNLTHILLMKTKNQDELKQISSELGGELSPEEFYDVFNQAVKDRYDFLFIDLAKKESHPSMFRRNFNEFILPRSQNQPL